MKKLLLMGRYSITEKIHCTFTPETDKSGSQIANQQFVQTETLTGNQILVHPAIVLSH